MDKVIDNVYHTAVPAPATIALALAVVRSKPAHTTIDEHLDEIVESIGWPTSPNGQDTGPKIDAFKYWQDRCHRIEQEKAALEDELAQLKTDLKAARSLGRSTQKRKPESQTSTKANTQLKRRKLDEAFEGDSSNIANAVEVSAAYDTGINGLLRALASLQQSTAQTPPVVDDVRSQICRICSALDGLLNRETDLADRVLPIYSCVTKALRLVYDLEPPEPIFPTTCSSVIKSFQVILGRLHQIALDEVARREREEKRRSKKPRSNSKAAKSSGPEHEQKCHARLAAMSKLMSTWFDTLDLAFDADNELYEGLAIALFDHIGSSMSLLVFMDPHDKDTGLVPVTGLLDVAHLEPESAIATAHLSSPYLVDIMKAVVRVGRKRELQLHSTTTSDETLLNRVEHRLQHTLLRGMFGDEDESFNNAFSRRDEVEDSDLSIEEELAEQEQDPSASFIGQVWELLGWDVLSRRLQAS